MSETQTSGASLKDQNPQDIVQGQTQPLAPPQNDAAVDNGSGSNSSTGPEQPLAEGTDGNPKTLTSLGFIIPPQDVQKIIVKTAEWVAKKGQSFVEKLKSKQKGQFPFLEPDHFYYVFYKRLLDEFESEIREYGSIQSKLGPELLEKLSDRKTMDGTQKPTTSQSPLSSQSTTSHKPPQAAPRTLSAPPLLPSTGASSSTIPPPPPAITAPAAGTGASTVVSATVSHAGAPPTTTQVSTASPGVLGVQKTTASLKKDEVQPGASNHVDVQQPGLRKKEAFSMRMEGVSKMSSQPTEDPFPRTFALDIPKDLTEMQFEIIKTTAMYVAKNGMQFLGAISSKHASNPLFEFTKLSHQHFAFFSKLCDVYKKLIKPSQRLRENILLMADEKNKYKVLQRLYEKAEWDMIERERKRRFRERKKEEQEAMLKVDWQSFSIVATIDFNPEETKNLPVDIVEGFEDSSAEESGLSIEAESTGMSVPSGEEESTLASQHLMNETGTRILGETHEPLDVMIDEEGKRFVNIGGRRVQIKQDYSRQVGTVEKHSEIKYVRGEDGTLIPMSELQHHMKVSLIDPQWKEQKKKEMEKHLFTNLASNAEMAERLSDLARARQETYQVNNVLNNELTGLDEVNDPQNLKEPTEPPRKKPRTQ